MKYPKLLAGIAVATVVTVIFVIAQPRIAAREYAASIEAHRAEVDSFMQKSGESPLPFNAMKAFSGLYYYPVDPSFRIRARLVRFDNPEIIEVPTSAGTVDPYTRYAELSFEIAGKALTLEAWKPMEAKVSNRLFVAFTDLTSGEETYGGGRYLNLYLDRDDTVTIDFNLAYNPYCVYDPAYVCPIAPPENRLAVAMTAGEKNWQAPDTQ